ncbi:MAG: hypothetical protein IPM81_12475 [Saprospirales bacterium]|nr:hypothetical protein [Saprospirales bacterium]
MTDLLGYPPGYFPPRKEILALSAHSDAALGWICRSIGATGGRGSSHSFSPVWGWALAYPETTGYLIPTLLWYAKHKPAPELRDLAMQCGKWLCAIQLPEGGFPGGLAGSRRPSAFNTAMILFGLAKLNEEFLSEENKLQFRISLRRAFDWLLRLVDPDGVWRQAGYVPGFVPSYYTRAVWGMLEAGAVLQQQEALEIMHRALQYYAGRFRPDGTVAEWGLRPGPRAFSHTVAYTLEGFLESSRILAEKEILDRIVHAGTVLLGEYRRTGRIAGGYGAGWKGDYRFRCLPGDAQISILFYRLWETTADEQFRRAAFDLAVDVSGYQKIGRQANIHGALAGSAPFWGPYLRLRYPNWGAKFLLDAIAPFLSN